MDIAHWSLKEQNPFARFPVAFGNSLAPWTIHWTALSALGERVDWDNINTLYAEERRRMTLPACFIQISTVSHFLLLSDVGSWQL